MKEKAKAIFDSRVTWATIGTLTGSLFGDQVAAIVNAFGALVMVII